MSVRNLFLKLTDGITTRLKSDLSVQVEQWAITRGTTQTVTITLYDGETQLLNAYLAWRAWEFALGTSYDADDAVLLADSVTVSGDTLVAVFSGTNTAEAVAALAGMPLVQLFAGVRGVPNGTAIADVSYWFPAKLLNVPGTADPAENVKANYFTKAETEARLYSTLEAAEISEASAVAASGFMFSASRSVEDCTRLVTSGGELVQSSVELRNLASQHEQAARGYMVAASGSVVSGLELVGSGVELRDKAAELVGSGGELLADTREARDDAAASVILASAAAVNAQNYELVRYNAIVAAPAYSDSLGYYKALTSAGDTVALAYNVTDCEKVALHLKSANPAITGNITATIAVNGAAVLTATIPVGATAGWVELSLGTSVTGVMAITLVSGLTDGATAVSTIVDGLRVVCRYAPVYAGYVERQVAIRPLFYASGTGYYGLLDSGYSIAFGGQVSGLSAVALRMVSANSAITGNVSLTLTVGAVSKTVVLAVGATAAWKYIALDSVASGAVTIVRNVSSATDTLKDGSTVVSAVVGDVNYIYMEA